MGGEPKLMPQLLLEFFSEEIPARMQKRAEEDLARALGEKLKAGAGHQSDGDVFDAAPAWPDD